MSYGLTAAMLRDLPEVHGTVFFRYDAAGQLVPMQPEAGQWFCEFDWDTDVEGEDFVRDGQFVQFVGMIDRTTLEGEAWVTVQRHGVATECDDDEVREPGGAILVYQG